MSNLGMEEELASHDELTLVNIIGSGGIVYDCDGDPLFRIPAANVDGAKSIFPILARAYRAGHTHGERSGRWSAQFDIRKALGV